MHPPPDSDKSQIDSPYQSVLEKIIDKLHEQLFLFIIAIVMLLIGLVVFGKGLLSPDMRFIVAVIAALAVVAIVVYYFIWHEKAERVQSPKASLKIGPLGDQKFNDYKVDKVKTDFDKLHSAYGTTLPKEALLPQLKELFCRRTFDEDIAECPDQDWKARLSGGYLTWMVLDAYKKNVSIIASDKMSDYTILLAKVQQYTANIASNLFEPPLTFYEAKDYLEGKLNSIPKTFPRGPDGKLLIPANIRDPCEEERNNIEAMSTDFFG